MQGQHQYQRQLFHYFDIESLIPQNHLLRKVDRCVDLGFVRNLTEIFYCSNNGRPSIDPELFFRMILIGYLNGIDSDRQLCDEIQYNLAYRWFCRLNLEDKVPDHSSLTRIRDRFGLDVFNSFFINIVELGYVREGDTLVVWKLDRLGRSIKHLIQLMTSLNERKIGL